MDQDFHFYGTFHSARCAGFDKDDATLIAKAANFIDLFKEETYASNWGLVSDTKKTSKYHTVAIMEYPRYTYQGGLLGTMFSPEDGLWCSYHFLPGNYDDPAGTPTREEIHGADVVRRLPDFIKRDTSAVAPLVRKYYPEKLKDLEFGRLLTRPQSALSRRLVEDAVLCATSDDRLERILGLAIGGEAILKDNRADVLRRFKLILLGIRAHIVADTWAHQDHCGLDNLMNTYWDADYDPDSWNITKMGLLRQGVYYKDGTHEAWEKIVLNSHDRRAWYNGNLLANPNFEAVPNNSSYLGHGWLGHFPDFSFIKFQYKPCWSNPEHSVERDNPREYESAWIELTSLFFQAKTGNKLEVDDRIESAIAKARQAINAPCNLKSLSLSGRKSSEIAWGHAFPERPSVEIDVDNEEDPRAVLEGALQLSKSLGRNGISYVNIQSDLYLFQIAADYHFHFVKHYLRVNNIYRFWGSWSQQRSTLPNEIEQLFE